MSNHGMQCKKKKPNRSIRSKLAAHELFKATSEISLSHAHAHTHTHERAQEKRFKRTNTNQNKRNRNINHESREKQKIVSSRPALFSSKHEGKGGASCSFRNLADAKNNAARRGRPHGWPREALRLLFASFLCFCFVCLVAFIFLFSSSNGFADEHERITTRGSNRFAPMCDARYGGLRWKNHIGPGFLADKFLSSPRGF